MLIAFYTHSGVEKRGAVRQLRNTAVYTPRSALFFNVIALLTVSTMLRGS